MIVNYDAQKISSSFHSMDSENFKNIPIEILIYDFGELQRRVNKRLRPKIISFETQVL